MIIQLIKGNVYQKCNEVNEIKFFVSIEKDAKTLNLSTKFYTNRASIALSIFVLS